MTFPTSRARITLTDFSVRAPPYRIAQAAALEWLAGIHAAAEATAERLGETERDAFAERMRAVLARCACGPAQIAARQHVVPDVERWARGEPSCRADEPAIYDVSRDPRGSDAGVRAARYDQTVSSYFEKEYASEAEPPDDLIHVTCTGYLSPSGAQKLVAHKGWGAKTRVTHAYHMGCYAAFPAVRMAAGFLALPMLAGRATSSTRDRAPKVDIVHTELCSLHLDPHDHSLEQLVVQSLFGDGLVRYTLKADAPRGLSILSLHEQIVEDSLQDMSWVTSSANLRMTLSRSAPEKIARSLPTFVAALYQHAELGGANDMKDTVFAVHPGGPKIIDAVKRVLELDERQVSASRQVLYDFGNISSATLAHVWARIVADPAVLPGTLVASLAFGPGLTVSGALFRKV